MHLLYFLISSYSTYMRNHAQNKLFHLTGMYLKLVSVDSVTFDAELNRRVHSKSGCSTI